MNQPTEPLTVRSVLHALREKRETLVVTPDWLPIGVSASVFLDALQKEIGGTRGYGTSGHTLTVKHTTRNTVESAISRIKPPFHKHA